MNKNKNLIIFAPSYLPNIGGVENHILNTIKLLRQDGWSITVFVRYSSNYPKKLIVEDVPVVRMPRSINIAMALVWAVQNFRLLLSTQAIHSHDYFPAHIKKLLSKKRWIHTFHGYEGYPLLEENIKSRRRVREEVAWCAGIGKFIEKWYGTKCDYISYGGVDINRFIKNKNVQIKWDYIFYGRLENDTGFESYIKAFSNLSQKNLKLNMLVVGSGSKESWAKTYVKKHKLSVEFMPPQPNIENYLHGSRVAFVSGYLAFIECFLAKVPIVAYYNNPIKEDYIRMHPAADSLSIAGSVDKIIEGAQEQYHANSAKIETAFNWAKEQSWNKIAVEYSDQYIKK